MSNNKNHIDPNHELNELDELLFEQADVSFSTSKQDVLAQIKGNTKQVKAMRFGAIKVAASLAIILGSAFAFMNIYTKSYSTGNSVLANVNLPDGSTVKLNANSNLSVKPYWWFVNRNVKFEGEGFFTVEKGSKFIVESANGSTSVLGTSFNINSRNSDYTVYCKTGKVLVQNSNSKVEITPNKMAKMAPNGELITSTANEEIVLSWTNGLLNFKNTSLKQVFNELQTQYDITIEVSRNVDLFNTYTGIFTKPTNPIEALSIICITHNLQVYQQDTNRFLIKK
ncbi:MAG: FecR family protein [Bacteroidia bacterium]